MVPLGIIIEDDKLCMTNYTFQKSLKNTAAFIFPHMHKHAAIINL